MNKREALRALERRKQYLYRRIRDIRAQRGTSHFERAEHGAICYAINAITSGVVNDEDNTVEDSIADDQMDADYSKQVHPVRDSDR